MAVSRSTRGVSNVSSGTCPEGHAETEARPENLSRIVGDSLRCLTCKLDYLRIGGKWISKPIPYMAEDRATPAPAAPPATAQLPEALSELELLRAQVAATKRTRLTLSTAVGAALGAVGAQLLSTDAEMIFAPIRRFAASIPPGFLAKVGEALHEAMGSMDDTPTQPESPQAKRAAIGDENDITCYDFVVYDHTSDAKYLAVQTRIVEALNQSVGPGSPFDRIHGTFGSVRIGDLGKLDRIEDEIAIHVRYELPEAPGAAAYHSVTNGVPDIEVALNGSASLTEGFSSVSVDMDHEIKELLKDVGANGWKENGKGIMRAEEVSDMVQNTFYLAPNGVALSNFLRPAAWIPGAKGPWDFLGLMTSADDYSHGYDIEASAPTNVHDVQGKRVFAACVSDEGVALRIVGVVSEAQKQKQMHWTSRTYRRGFRHTAT